MRVKICGMQEVANVAAVANLGPQLMGFIFYHDSPRYVSENELVDCLQKVHSDIATVAVFVNEKLGEVKRICTTYDFQYAQLHGQESPDYCQELTCQGIAVIKAFQMDETFDMGIVDAYVGQVELFLFDTKTDGHGGSGKHFDWTLLSRYEKSTPYLLSGGISAEDIDRISSLDFAGLIGIDANSRLEDSPGKKSLEKTRALIEKIRQT